MAISYDEIGDYQLSAESFHPVTDGNGYIIPQQNSRPNSENSAEEVKE